MRVAAWQCEPGPRDVEGNLRRLGRACAEAAGRGAEVLVTPEMFSTGYGLAPEEVARFAEADQGGPVEAAVAGIARRAGIAIVYGHPERARDEGGNPGGDNREGGSAGVYNTATMISPNGPVVARHRKVHLFGEFDRRLFASNPRPPTAFGFAGTRLGMLICYDVEFGETVRRLAGDGARAVLVPTANMTEYDEVPLEAVPRQARESGCGIVYANYCGSDEVFAYGGLSVICGPAGETLALADAAGEEVIVADLPVEPNSLSTERRPDLAEIVLNWPVLYESNYHRNGSWIPTFSRDNQLRPSRRATTY